MRAHCAEGWSMRGERSTRDRCARAHMRATRTQCCGVPYDHQGMLTSRFALLCDDDDGDGPAPEPSQSPASGRPGRGNQDTRARRASGRQTSPASVSPPSLPPLLRPSSPLIFDVSWTCRVCTLVNLLPGECCEACGVAAAWSCGTCTLENEADARACGACGSQRHGLVEETVERKSSGPGRPPSACFACRPRVECVACRTRRRNAALLERERSLLERETQRTTAHIRWESSGLHPLYADEDIEAARLSSVPGDLRAPILEAAAAQPTSVGAVDAASLRRMMEAAEIAQRGGALSAPAEELATSATTAEGRPVRLDTVWAVEGRHPHRRAEALLAAGWQPVMRGANGGVGSHLKYRRCLVLPDGSAMQAQVLTFSSTPSDCRSWDNEAAKLQRVDREATAEIEAALDQLYVRSLG